MSTAQPPRIAQRLIYHWPYVASSSILSDEIREGEGEEAPVSLRAEASADGLCFLRIQVYLPHANLYRAQVAASTALLKTCPLNVFLTEEQLFHALPLDCRLQQNGKLLDPTTILARIAAHAKASQPPTRVVSEAETPLHPAPIVPLAPVVDLVVTAEEVQDVLPAGSGRARVQRALLFLALQKLGYVFVRGKKQYEQVLTHTGLLLQQLRRWHRTTNQRVVNIVEDGWQWRLLIGAPDVLAWAA